MKAPSESAERNLAARAVYVHVPFCRHRCGYCDFTLVANRDHLILSWLQALRNEMQLVEAPLEVDTIFIGGGTPTHLPPHQLEAMFELIATQFTLAPGGECSVEANPDGLSDDHLQVLRSAGVNRLSLGVQSFDDECLRTLERQHLATDAIETIHRSAEVIDNVSVDLIFGVPGQTLETWRSTLQLATSLPLRHVSTYGLTYETGTSFFRRERSGDLRRTPDELERDMYLTAIDNLAAFGFEHYEVSNFAKPGFRCRHNLTYWNADEYFAFGPGAASYLRGERLTNSRNVTAWINSWLRHEPCVGDRETLTPEEKAREAVMLGLRMIDGLDIASFRYRFGTTPEDLDREALRKHIQSGLLQIHNGRLKLTRQGLLIADSVVADFL